MATSVGTLQEFLLDYDHFRQVVHAATRRVVRDREMAEDIAQEVFLEVWLKAGEYDPGKGSPAAWIATISYRRSVDRVRSDQARSEREHHHDRIVTGQRSDPVAEAVTIKLQRDEVWTALDHLTPVQRQAVILAFYGDNSYRRVADILDQPEGTVKRRIRDGLRILASVMAIDS